MNARTPLTALGIAAALVLGTAGGYWFASRPASHPMPEQKTELAAPAPTAGPEGERKVLYWHDPMVPLQRFDKPGKSPFMDMELEPVYADTVDGSSISISPRTLQNLGVRTATAERGRFWRRVDTVGTVQPDERRIEAVQSRTAGWVEKLHVRAAGDAVTRGQLLAELYSPELLAAQEEYLLLLRNPADAALAQSARDRLSFLGLGAAQIGALEQGRRADQRVRITAPIGGVVADLGVRQGAQVGPGMNLFSLVDLSSVWLIAEVPEDQVGWIDTGKTIEARVKALPGEIFEGKVEYIYPEVSPVTRTVRVRARLANPGLKLRPGMVAEVTLFGGARKDVLMVPSEALIHTGRRSVVIVAEPGSRFRAAEIVTGMEDGERTEVLRGLEEGAQVVVSGQFLIDSEASLKTALTRLDGSGSTDSAGQSAGVTSHAGTGTVTAIDAKAGRLTIEHGPIATLDWPGMTMGFAVKDVALLGALQPGQQVEFEFAESGDDYVISRIVPAGQ